MIVNNSIEVKLLFFRISVEYFNTFWLYKNLQFNNSILDPKFDHSNITRRLIGPNQQSGVGNSYDIGFSP